ncbi:MAG: LysE family transporter [Clostridia bacterium]|nr:LysE family transporter [Clostridia bacterium]
MIDFSGMLLYLAVSAFTPGPNNLMCMYLGATYGLKGSRKFITASMASVFVKALLCGLLNVALASVIPAVVPVLKWVGAAYMLYLAWTMLKSGMKGGQVGEKKGESTYSAGILLQILNMKSWVSAISLFSVYVVPYTTALWAVLAGAGTMLGLLIAASLSWCLFGRAIKNVYEKYRLPISILMALSLVYCAVTAVL